MVAGLAGPTASSRPPDEPYDLGFHVIVVGDAINNPDAQGHEHGVTRVFPTLGQVCTTDELVRLLPGAP
jgi:isochorismate hydrolase